jgi:hypothetical protein
MDCRGPDRPLESVAYFDIFPLLNFSITPPTSPKNSSYTNGRTRSKLVTDDLLYNFTFTPSIPSLNESLPLFVIMTSFCLITTVVTESLKVSYSCLSRLAVIEVTAYGQKGRDCIINFSHGLSRFKTCYSLEHTVDHAQMIPAWERTFVSEYWSKRGKQIHN